MEAQAGHSRVVNLPLSPRCMRLLWKQVVTEEQPKKRPKKRPTEAYRIELRMSPRKKTTKEQQTKMKKDKKPKEKVKNLVPQEELEEIHDIKEEESEMHQKETEGA